MELGTFAERVEMGIFLAGGFGLLLAVVTGSFLVLGRRIPPFVPPLAVALPGLVGVLAAAALGAWSPSDAADLLREAASARVGNRLVFVLLTAPIAMVLLLFLAVAGARRPPRHHGLALVGVLLALATAALPIVGGHVNGTPEFGWVRGLLYLGAGALGSLALLSGGERDENGPEAAAAAGLVLPLVVAAGEVSLRAMNELIFLMALEGRDPLTRVPFVEEGFARGLDIDLPWSWAALATASLFALLGAVPALRRGGRRAASAGAALLWLGAALLHLRLGQVSLEHALALARALPAG